MPKPRKPLALLRASGALKKNPKRYADRSEPAGLRPLGKPSQYLSVEQRKCYREIAKSCHDGVLCQSDTIAVEMAAILLDKIRQNTAKSAEMTLFNGFLSKFGMTPVDRSRVSIPQLQSSNPFADN